MEYIAINNEENPVRYKASLFNKYISDILVYISYG